MNSIYANFTSNSAFGSTKETKTTSSLLRNFQRFIFNFFNCFHFFSPTRRRSILNHSELLIIHSTFGISLNALYSLDLSREWMSHSLRRARFKSTREIIWRKIVPSFGLQSVFYGVTLESPTSPSWCFCSLSWWNIAKSVWWSLKWIVIVNAKCCAEHWSWEDGTTRDPRFFQSLTSNRVTLVLHL